MFSESHIFCYQEVLQKLIPGTRRKALHAGRDTLSLNDGPSEILEPPIYDSPVVQLRAGDTLSMWGALKARCSLASLRASRLRLESQR